MTNAERAWEHYAERNEIIEGIRTINEKAAFECGYDEGYSESQRRTAELDTEAVLLNTMFHAERVRAETAERERDDRAWEVKQAWKQVDLFITKLSTAEKERDELAVRIDGAEVERDEWRLRKQAVEEERDAARSCIDDLIDRLAEVGKERDEAHEEIDALVRAKTGLTETIESLEAESDQLMRERDEARVAQARYNVERKIAESQLERTRSALERLRDDLRTRLTTGSIYGLSHLIGWAEAALTNTDPSRTGVEHEDHHQP